MDLEWGKSPLAIIAVRANSGSEVRGHQIEPPDDSTAIKLAERLLSLDGDYVLIHDDEPPDFRAWIVKDGTDQTREKINVVPGHPNECHRNCVTLWKKTPDTISIVSGYCLSEDGMWREHTWLVDASDAIIETTVPRTRYFGVRLNAGSAQQFHDLILGPTPSIEE